MITVLPSTQGSLLVLASLLAWVTYRIYRAAVVKSTVPGLPGPRPDSWAAGNLGIIYSPSEEGMQFHLDVPKKHGFVAKIAGMFGDEQLYVTDPLALQHILVKDGNNFDEDNIVQVFNQLMFGTCLMSTTGEHHKRQRKALNPAFSHSVTKRLAPTIYEVTRQLCTFIDAKAQGSPGDKIGVIDVYDAVSRASLEMIGQCGIGYDFNVLDPNATSTDEYAGALHDIMPSFFKLQLEFVLLASIAPSWSREFINFYPKKAAKRIKEMIRITTGTTKKILDERRASRKVSDVSLDQKFDLVKVLLEQNESASNVEKMPDEEVQAQMSLLIFAASDTTSSAISRALFMLAKSQDIQDKLRQELAKAKAENAKQNGSGTPNLAYEELMALPYLDAVCRETLRLYPPTPYLTRICHKDTVVPLSQPLTLVDGSRISAIPIRKNQKIYAGIATANQDERLWGDDAAEWKPERWLAEVDSDGGKVETRVPKQATDAKLPGIYSGMMTFFAGNRSCIGVNLAQLEMKTVLSVLIKSFKFKLSETDISWTLGLIQVPRLKGLQTEAPQMPLRVTPLDEVAP